MVTTKCAAARDTVVSEENEMRRRQGLALRWTPTSHTRQCGLGDSLFSSPKFTLARCNAFIGCTHDRFLHSNLTTSKQHCHATRSWWPLRYEMIEMSQLCVSTVGQLSHTRPVPVPNVTVCCVTVHSGMSGTGGPPPVEQRGGAGVAERGGAASVSMVTRGHLGEASAQRHH